VDAARRAHARRWTHRQSGLSAVRDATSDVLVVMEAVHPGGRKDVDALAVALAEAIGQAWGSDPLPGKLSRDQPQFSFA